MKIALAYAMAGEIESLLTATGAKLLETVHGVPFYEIEKDIIAYAGGIGKVNAAMAAQLCIDRYQPDWMINAGVAGSFRDLPIGTVVLLQNAEKRLMIIGYQRRSAQGGDKIYDYCGCLYSAAPNDGENLEALAALARLAGWIEAQNALGRYPELPAGCTALNVETLPGDDPLSALDEGGAKYMLQIRIRYEKE